MNLPTMITKFPTNTIKGLNSVVYKRIIAKRTNVNQSITPSYMQYNYYNIDKINFIKNNNLKYIIIDKYGQQLNITIDEFDCNIHAIQIYPYY